MLLLLLYWKPAAVQGVKGSQWEEEVMMVWIHQVMLPPPRKRHIMVISGDGLRRMSVVRRFLLSSTHQTTLLMNESSLSEQHRARVEGRRETKMHQTFISITRSEADAGPRALCRRGDQANTRSR